MRRSILGLVLALVLPFHPVSAEERAYVPERRLTLTADTDFQGGDIKSVFDTTLEACEATCLATDDCTAMTFNARANSCFLKSGPGSPAPYAGAISGIVLDAAPGARDRAARRAGELTFLSDADFDAALEQARNLARDHVTGDWTAEDLLASVEAARTSGDIAAAVRFQASALNLTDAADQWVEYARLLIALPAADDSERQAHGWQALSAALNGYLRAGAVPVQASALDAMAQAFEMSGRGRDMIPALRLAQKLQPRDEQSAMLDDAVGKYGFRVTGTTVDSDSAAPRLCATFSEALETGGQDYSAFVQLPDQGLAVEALPDQICIDGVEHGKHYQVTFREGLPAASGEVLAKDVTVQNYVRDRAAAARFPGRAYILPRAADSGIPVETVNATQLDLKLMRISDRNLVRAMATDYFARPLDSYGAYDLSSELTQDVWKGTADLAKADANRDVTTRLPMDEALKGQPPGIYVLEADIPGANPEQTPPALQWFVVSDLGLTTLSGTDGLHVFVRGLADAQASERAVVTLVSRANAVIATTTTDADGYARFADGLVSGTGGAAPALVTVAEGDDLSFLSLTEPEFDLSDRGVAGRPAAPSIDVFLATDRGAYRAGETVHATILARDPAVKAIAGLPLTVRLLRPDGVEYSRMQAPDAGAGGRAVSVPLDGGAPRGTWRIEALAEKDGQALASESFLVEDFLPERIDFTLALPEHPLKITDTTDIAIAARYLFGAPGGELAIEGDYSLSAATTIGDFPGYRFGRHDDAFSPVSDSLAVSGVTDAEGKAAVPLSLPQDLGAAAVRPMNLEVAVRLNEGSGRPVERRIERLVLPDTPVIGIKPAFAGDAATQDTEARFSLIAVGPDGKRASARARWTLNRLESRYQWYSLYGQWNWDVTTTRQRIATGDVDLAAGGDVAQIAPRVEWGEYELVVEDAGGKGGAASMTFYAGWNTPADASTTPDTLELALDRPAYRAGDTAHVRIVPRNAGVALVSVMSNHLIAMRAVAVKEGENIIDLPVTDDWGAGAYVTASVIRPLAEKADHAPNRALGLSYAPVDPGVRRLATRIEAAAAVDPRGPLPVAVKVDGIAPGAKAYVTLAAVDVGILNLTASMPPDPVGHYFGQQRLGMAIRDVYGRLIDGQNGAMGTVRSGGDAGGVKLKAPPPTEELVAYFTGPIEVGADGYARSSFDLPSFNGTVKLMAVVWSETAVGQANTDVIVRDPVVVTASVPRFMAPGDRSTLRLELAHADGPAGRMALSVTAEGLTVGAVPDAVDLAEKGRVHLTIPVTAAATTADGRLTVTLTTPAGKALVKKLMIPVEANDPAEMVQSRFSLAPGKSLTLGNDLFAGLVPGSGRVTLALGPVARFNAPGILAALQAYPYGCTEQLVSRAMPLLYFREVAAAMGSAGEGDFGERIRQSLGEILLRQSSNGAFGLWYPDAGDLWLDAYVTDFLGRARTAGYEVPELAFRNALDNLRNQVNASADFDGDGGPMAYALLVLAREGAAAMNDLRYYADVKAETFDTPFAAAQLGAALAAYGDQTRADRMFARAGEMVGAADLTRPDAQVWRADYGTSLRDATALFALATEARSKAVDTDRIGGAVAAGLMSRPLSTQEETWALLATHAALGEKGNSDFTLNGAPLDGPLVHVFDDKERVGETIIANRGGAESTLTLTTFGVPKVPAPADGNGYQISRSWYTLDGTPVDLATVPQGTRMVAVIEVTPLGPGGGRLIVDDPLPAGFEIDNPNLIRGGDIAALDWLTTADPVQMTEFRRDRFVAALDWTETEPFRLAYIVRAISPGTYHLPAASVEDMYRPDYRAHSDAGEVTVTE